eukprot:TRINITY_DN6683_c0_g2_i2.p1 TRINITY_DN6683_c0_g2~~TRINITY_DN6683_c0_g2_i2.p1  ORF type:complete len:367 (-),score=73.60 TRINITY_DN6683_c0_g2_i2:218-1318(-)
MKAILLILVVLVFRSSSQEQIPGPKNPSVWMEWLTAIKAQREKDLRSINYTGEIYAVPELEWTQTAFIQPQMMAHDLYFWDPLAEGYTVDKYLNDVDNRYGGIDSVLIWHSYPNMGIDNRNQFDLLRAMPGGLQGFADAVSDFQSRGVNVLIPYNPWDQGTRDEGRSDEESLAVLLKEVGADGFNGDTMYGVPRSFYDASVQVGHPLALEPEGGMPVVNINWTTLSWGYWDLPWVPSVDLYKWLDSRHMTHVCSRWATNRTDVIQAAFFNGVGYETWENVWGIWMAITPRYGETIRRVSSILRQFSEFFLHGEWEPHTPTVQNDVVFASKWTLQGSFLFHVGNGKQKTFHVTNAHSRDPKETPYGF